MLLVLTVVLLVVLVMAKKIDWVMALVLFLLALIVLAALGYADLGLPR